MRRPWVWLGASLAIIVVLALPVAQPEDARLDGEAPARSAPSRCKGIAYINREFGDNALNPIQIVLQTKPGGVFTPKFLTGLDKLSNTLAADRRANSVTSLATYMAAEPRDGRYENLKPDHDFWPAPKFEGLAKNEPTPGVFLTNYISVWAPKVPYNPAYFGWGVFTFAPGTSKQLKVAQTLQVYRVNSGAVTVEAGRPTTLWRNADFGKRDKGKTVPAGSPVTLRRGDQLVVPELTPVELHDRRAARGDDDRRGHLPRAPGLLVADVLGGQRAHDGPVPGHSAVDRGRRARLHVPEGRGAHHPRPLPDQAGREVPAPPAPGAGADQRHRRDADDLLVAGDGDHAPEHDGRGGAVRHGDPAPARAASRSSRASASTAR